MNELYAVWKRSYPDALIGVFDDELTMLDAINKRFIVTASSLGASGQVMVNGQYFNDLYVTEIETNEWIYD